MGGWSQSIFALRRWTVTTAHTSVFTVLMFYTWLFNDCGILSVYKLIGSIYTTCISEVILFLMIQLHILFMKHQPESCFQTCTNITSNLLCRHLFLNLDNKEPTFNSSTTFASWKKRKQCSASTESSSSWKLNAKNKYGIPSCDPVVFCTVFP